MKRVLITGATGFVGRALCLSMEAAGWQVRAVSRSQGFQPIVSARVEYHQVKSINSETDWSGLLDGVSVVIHLAARVHIMQDTATDPLKEFRRVNLYGTERLARQAAAAGVKRFVFMSTIGVNGDNSGSHPYTERDTPHPHNPYSVSKYEAELDLEKIAAKTGMEVVVIRAPLVYGPGNPGNFLSLLRIVAKGVPLPFASLANARSLVFVGNLVNALAACSIHPAAAGRTYLVSDGEDVSTPYLIRRTARALCVPTRLFPFPIQLMILAGKATGKSAAVNRLTGSLTVDSSRIRDELGWQPPFSMEDGLRETAEWFKKAKC